MDDVESTVRHTIVEEEGIPIETVTNFEEVRIQYIQSHYKSRQNTLCKMDLLFTYCSAKDMPERARASVKKGEHWTWKYRTPIQYNS